MRRRKTRHQPHQPPIGSEMPVRMVEEVPLTGLSFVNCPRSLGLLKPAPIEKERS